MGIRTCFLLLLVIVLRVSMRLHQDAIRAVAGMPRQFAWRPNYTESLQDLYLAYVLFCAIVSVFMVFWFLRDRAILRRRAITLVVSAFCIGAIANPILDVTRNPPDGPFRIKPCHLPDDTLLSIAQSQRFGTFKSLADGITSRPQFTGKNIYLASDVIADPFFSILRSRTSRIESSSRGCHEDTGGQVTEVLQMFRPNRKLHSLVRSDATELYVFATGTGEDAFLMTRAQAELNGCLATAPGRQSGAGL